MREESHAFGRASQQLIGKCSRTVGSLNGAARLSKRFVVKLAGSHDRWRRSPALGAPLIGEPFDFNSAVVVEDAACLLLLVFRNGMHGDKRSAPAHAFRVKLRLLFRDAVIFEKSDDAAGRG